MKKYVASLSLRSFDEFFGCTHARTHARQNDEHNRDKKGERERGAHARAPARQARNSLDVELFAGLCQELCECAPAAARCVSQDHRQRPRRRHQTVLEPTRATLAAAFGETAAPSLTATSDACLSPKKPKFTRRQRHARTPTKAHKAKKEKANNKLTWKMIRIVISSSSKRALAAMIQKRKKK